MAIGETFLSAFLQVLFQQMLKGGVRQFLEMVGGVDLPNTIQNWKKELTRLEALLDDAELRQFHSKSVKEWLNDLQDLAYDIEDLLDHFATEAQVYKLKKAEEDEANAVIDHSNAGILDTVVQTIRVTNSRAADSLSNFLKPVDQDIRDKIDEITERLQDIENRKQILSLAEPMPQQTLQTETLRKQRESTSLVGKVFGRDDKKQEIIKMLLNDDQSVDNYVVIPIVGTGGVGKTTLAQYVYNDEQLEMCDFDLKAWVCVSDKFDAKRILMDIINSATQSNFSYSNLDQAQLKLKEVLKGKKFFIVLDDMWSEEYTDWEKLKLPFIHGAKGSRVIITTRNDSSAEITTVVNNTTQRNITKLERLSKGDSWLIFKQYVNVDRDLALMEDIIIEKVNGLPLAAKALGSLLKKNPKKSQRKKILESNVWVEESSVLPVLRLSYHHMPSHLKRVFAYCSVFPKGYKFMEMELVLLWMAQGFLSDPKTHDEKIEETGHNYFHDLISRSLFEESEGMFIMHDLIHDMAQLAEGDVYHVVMDARREIPTRARHLYITEHVQTLTNLTMARQLRSFLCKKAVNLDIQGMRYMRALHLVTGETEMPEVIGTLKHLRYLGLYFSNIEVLPKSIKNLCNLQTLCLDGCYGLELLPDIGWLEELRHMYINNIRLKEMPHGIGKLKNLQSLGKFVLAAGGGSRVRELGMLNHLRGSLTISGVEYVKKVEDAHEAQLNKKESLDELRLIWGIRTDEVDDMSVIEELKPHSTINKCELNGYMGLTFPTWLADSSFKVVDITLNKCHRCERLPSLGLLPSLKSLRISNMDGIKEVGLEFYGGCSNPFPALHTLHFSCMKSWEKWEQPSVYNGKAFPVLETFYIKSCKSLQGDLPHLPPSINLEIQECRKLKFVNFCSQ